MRICAHQFVGVVTNMGVAISKSHVAVRQIETKHGEIERSSAEIPLQGGLQSSNGGESDNPEE